MNKWYVAILITLLGVLCVPSAVLGQQEEAPRGKYYTLVDENNNIVHQTAIKVYPGDEYISSDNSRYKVVEVVGETARCVYQGEERMPVLNYNPTSLAIIGTGEFSTRRATFSNIPAKSRSPSGIANS